MTSTTHTIEPPVRLRNFQQKIRYGLGIILVGAHVVMSDALAQSDRGNALIEAAIAARPDVRDGGELYRANCASCHGRKAQGAISPVTPALAGQLPLYLIKQLVDLAEGERLEPAMHRIVAERQLTTVQAMSDISAFVRSLPPNTRVEVGDGKNLAVGKRYYEGLCAYCHGPAGRGNEEHATPVLAGQNYSYLLMQMRNLSVGHRYSVDIVVMQTLQSLDFATLTAIADYSARLSAAPHQVTTLDKSIEDNSP